MKRNLLALYGLKYNPFAPEVPAEALLSTARLESFALRVETLVSEGGFAAILGAPGSGKSSTMRILVKRLSEMPDVVVGLLSRPQGGVPDFYRELGSLFGVPLSPHNRWAGSQALRDRWAAHISSSRMRPVLLVDEAQEMKPPVINELRMMMSKDLDSCTLLTVILAGDGRLTERLQTPELLPVQSRLRVRLSLQETSRDDLLACLKHLLERSGNPSLLTGELMVTLVDHAAGNLRTLMNTANDLLLAGVEREGCRIDEKLFFDVMALPQPAKRPGTGGRR
jgi:type II secretory pathway predicted ATPase ExeA